MISLYRHTQLNKNYNNPCFKGQKEIAANRWKAYQLNDKLLHLNERETVVVEKVKDAELKFFAENGFHIATTKENIEEMIKSSGAYHCDAKIIFHIMKSFYDYDRSMESSLEFEKKHNNFTDPLRDYLAEKSEKTNEMLMAVKQNLIQLSPAAISE